MNGDPKVRVAVHLGDIKSGSTTCTDDRFAAVADVFATFEDPLVYTPGDNEWADCHRLNNGSYDPLERLSALRELFFMQADTWDPAPTPGQQAVVDRIAARTAAFDGQVLLLQGDSHTYLADNPTGLANFRRVVVHGETLPFEYLRLTIDPRDPDLFGWTRVMVP